MPTPSSTTLEKELGFHTTYGFLRDSKLDADYPEFRRFKDEIRKLTSELVEEKGWDLSQIKTSPQLVVFSETIFEEFGRYIWPDERSDAPWLATGTDNSLEGNYKKDLFYEVRSDRDR